MQVYDPYQALLQCFARFPDHEGLVFPETGRRLTFAQWLHDVHALASALRHAGIRPGERVAIWAENRIEWPVAQVAIAAIGAVMVPVNTHFRAEDVRHVLTHAGVAAILLSERFRANEYRSIIESLRPQLKHLRVVVNFDGFAVRSPGTLSYRTLLDEHSGQAVEAWQWNVRDCASIQYTSGTTGRPKGAELCFDGMLRNAQGTIERLGVIPGDRWTSIIPLFHCAGCIMNSLAALLAGATYVGISAFDAERMLKLIEDERCTVLTGVPTSFLAMLNHPRRAYYDLGSLRTGTCGGADCDPALLERCAREFPMQGLVQVYGQTEASTLISLDDAASPQRMRTAGLPLNGMEVRVTDVHTRVPLGNGEVGQLEVRGPMVMLGYHDDPVETDRTIDSDGWMQTGDLGCLRHDGRVELVGGRLRDVIIRGGENVYPVEVENLLREHPDIREIAVFAVPDHYYGEIVAAAIESDALLTPADLRQFCRGRIAGFKHPARVFSVSEWPMTSSGKIIKRQLQVAAKEGRLKELT
ncbi:AMP-binding protein [Paraburkholderia fungorum]|jgi:fatty-acyl-CoA synthase|uniref:AMP-binding protein n=1 Tax=Paraburkholderia fungorum TaxID=134537 RepID=UPI00161D092A|nr:AMP-binding protein [Paraburkholderia fungorum]USX11092.1 AMP-binding protein [Paraburkholderia fungorum]